MSVTAIENIANTFVALKTHEGLKHVPPNKKKRPWMTKSQLWLDKNYNTFTYERFYHQS